MQYLNRVLCTIRWGADLWEDEHVLETHHIAGRSFGPFIFAPSEGVHKYQFSASEF